MICPVCGTEMIINAWHGWIWMCYLCDHQGRHASDAEIEAQGHETEQMITASAADACGDCPDTEKPGNALKKANETMKQEFP